MDEPIHIISLNFDHISDFRESETFRLSQDCHKSFEFEIFFNHPFLKELPNNILGKIHEHIDNQFEDKIDHDSLAGKLADLELYQGPYQILRIENNGYSVDQDAFWKALISNNFWRNDRERYFNLVRVAKEAAFDLEIDSLKIPFYKTTNNIFLFNSKELSLGNEVKPFYPDFLLEAWEKVFEQKLPDKVNLVVHDKDIGEDVGEKLVYQQKVLKNNEPEIHKNFANENFNTAVKKYPSNMNITVFQHDQNPNVSKIFYTLLYDSPKNLSKNLEALFFPWSKLLDFREQLICKNLGDYTVTTEEMETIEFLKKETLGQEMHAYLDKLREEKEENILDNKKLIERIEEFILQYCPVEISQ